MPSTIIICAGGFDRPYVSDADEIQAIDSLSPLTHWDPSTLDFEATARTKHFIAKNASDFLGALQTSPGPIGRVVFIGHGSPYSIGLSGRNNNGVRFSEMISSTELGNMQAAAQALQPKFAKGATIDLVACYCGRGATFVQQFADTFNCMVRAFTGSVYWTIDINKGRITGRGKTCLDNRSFAAGFSHLRFDTTVSPSAKIPAPAH